MSLTVYAFVVTALTILIYRCRNIGRRPKGYPPGPPTLPLIGNLHQMPKEKAHLQFQKWAEEYGPIYSLILGTKAMVVLSSDVAVKDVLDKRSAIYSSRPDMHMAQIVSGGLRFSLMLGKRYGELWRKIHKVVHSTLNVNASQAYMPYQDLENKALLMNLIEQPERFIDLMRLYANSLTTQMIFGYRTTSTEDPRFKQFFRGFEKLSVFLGNTTAAVIDFYPILRSLPDALMPLRKYAKQLHEEELNLYTSHWLDTKRRYQEGTAVPSFCVDLARAQEKEDWSDLLAGYTSGVLLEAGSDTTSATLIGFIQAMLLFPAVAKTAQEEIDRVCGTRLPTFDDELPYIHSCIKESLRWMPTAILGIPHSPLRDDEYMGYTIPKDAFVVMNVWTIHMDPARHPNPRQFDPSRYANDMTSAKESANLNDPTQRDHFVFGAGRRFCQGSHIAERSLFLGIARLLWAFDFELAKDEQGNAIVPDASELNEGALTQPKRYPASIRPRSQERVDIIRKEWDKMQEFLDEEGQWKVMPPEVIEKVEKSVARD
ncbi:hypothetical protein E8E13_001610 [Curvularia kusanoi]|uniref:Cytochrome P450 n=1 Tax=Curvularia kusanoi TaxID=90978 RepID=A0A9P4T4H7_CURKU|nr:hypothetical protein E8E13_001610 [Curvularia kusanoi]